MRTNTKQDDLGRAQAIAANPASISQDLWGDFPDRIIKVVKRIARKFSQNKTDREDIQDALRVKLVEVITDGKFTGEGSLDVWLAKVATNAAIDFFRKKERQPKTVSHGWTILVCG